MNSSVEPLKPTSLAIAPISLRRRFTSERPISWIWTALCPRTTLLPDQELVILLAALHRAARPASAGAFGRYSFWMKAFTRSSAGW